MVLKSLDKKTIRPTKGETRPQQPDCSFRLEQANFNHRHYNKCQLQNPLF